MYVCMCVCVCVCVCVISNKTKKYNAIINLFRQNAKCLAFSDGFIKMLILFIQGKNFIMNKNLFR